MALAHLFDFYHAMICVAFIWLVTFANSQETLQVRSDWKSRYGPPFCCCVCDIHIFLAGPGHMAPPPLGLVVAQPPPFHPQSILPASFCAPRSSDIQFLLMRHPPRHRARIILCTFLHLASLMRPNHPAVICHHAVRHDVPSS